MAVELGFNIDGLDGRGDDADMLADADAGGRAIAALCGRVRVVRDVLEEVGFGFGLALSVVVSLTIDVTMESRNYPD